MPCACIICAIFKRKKEPIVDRITEKLKRASGVAQRAALAIEGEADKLIAREEELANKTAKAFSPHHAVLDARNRELTQLEDSLQILSNADPLASSGDGGTVLQPAAADARPQ